MSTADFSVIPGVLKIGHPPNLGFDRCPQNWGVLIAQIWTVTSPIMETLSHDQNTDILPAPPFALKDQGFMVGIGNLTIPLQIAYRYLISSKPDDIRAEFSAMTWCYPPSKIRHCYCHKITLWQPHTAVFIWWCLCLYLWSYWRCTAKHRIPRWVVKCRIPRIMAQRAKPSNRLDESQSLLLVGS